MRHTAGSDRWGGISSLVLSFLAHFREQWRNCRQGSLVPRESQGMWGRAALWFGQNRGSHKDSAYAQDSLSLSCKVADGPVSAALASRGSSDSGGMRRAQKGSENRSKPVSLPCLGVDTPNSVAQENSLFLLKMTQFTGQAEMKPTCRNKSVHYLKVPR